MNSYLLVSESELSCNSPPDISHYSHLQCSENQRELHSKGGESLWAEATLDPGIETIWGRLDSIFDSSAIFLLPVLVNSALRTLYLALRIVTLSFGLQKWKCLSLRHDWLSVTPWTGACQASPIHRLFQAWILEWVAMPSSSRESSQPRDQTQVPLTAGRFFTVWATMEAHWSPEILFIVG